MISAIKGIVIVKAAMPYAVGIKTYLSHLKSMGV